MSAAPTTITLDVPRHLVLNLNQRRDPRGQSRLVKELRTMAAWAKLAQARDARLDRAHCLCTLTFRTKDRRRDPHNYTPTAKAIIDGVVSGAERRPSGAPPWPHGLLPDDSSDYLTGPDMRDAHDPDLPKGIVRATLTFTSA